MAAGGLAKLKLELEINGDKVVVNGLNTVDSAIERTARTTKTATEQMAGNMGNVSVSIGNISTVTGRAAAEYSRHTQSMTSGMTSFEKSIQSVTMRVWNLTMAAGMIAAPFAAVGAAIYKGVEIVDDFQMSVTQIAAQLTQLQGPKDVAKHYQESVVYATALAKKMEEVDANSQANNKGLEAMLQTMTTQGVVLDINNKKQVDAFTDLSNAIAMTTKGQDQQMQMYQEMRALTTGQIDQHSQLSRMLDAQVKQQGVYKGGLKEVVELGKQHGDLLERLQPYLVGINAATADISQSWSAAKSSFETATNAVARAGFTETARDVAGWLREANVYLKTHATEIGGSIQAGWSVTKGLIEGAFTALQVGGNVLQVSIIPLFEDTYRLGKGTVELIQTTGYIIQSSTETILLFGGAVYYSVGGIAAMTAVYAALTATITASMAANPIGWVAAGIGAIYLAAKPAVKYLDELIYKTTQLNLTGEAYYNAEMKRAAEADKRWEETKQRALWAWKEGGIAPSPGMQAQLSISNPQAPKIPPPPPGRDKEAEAAAKAELATYNQFVAAYNDKLRTIEAGDITLTAHERELQRIHGEYEKLIEQYPRERAELEQLERYHVQEVTKRQEQADAIKATSDEFKAMFAVWEKEPPAPELRIGRTPEEVKAEIDLSRLSLEMKLAEVDAQEKFYQLTTGQAATQRISLLQQQLQLETGIYQTITEQGAVGDLARTQQLQKITQINTALLEQQRILNDSTAVGAAISALKEYGRAAADIGVQTKGVVTDFFQGMEDALVEFARHSKLSISELTSSVLDDLARMGVKQGIMGPLSGMMSALLAPSMSFAATPAAGFTAGGQPMASFAPDSFGAFLSGSVKAGAAAGTEAGAAAGVTSGMAMAGGALAVAVGAYLIGSNVLDVFGGSNSRWGNMSTGSRVAYGAAMTNPIGWGLMGLDSLMGGSIFGGKQKMTAQGLELGVGAEGLYGSQYTTIKTDGGMFGSDSKKTKYSAIEAAYMAALSGQYSSILSNVSAGSALVGGSGDLSGFTSAVTKINMKGMDAEAQQEAIQKYFRDISDAAITSLYPEIAEFSQLGESATDTFNRLTSSAAAVNDWFTQLGLTLNDVSLAGAAASDSLVQALGGLQAANTAMNTYLTSSLFSEAEQEQMKIASASATLNLELGKLGLAVPTTAAEFNNLVTANLALGAAGAETAAALINLAPAFSVLVDSAAAAAERAAAITATNNNLTVQLLSLQGDAAGSLALQRSIETAGMDESTLAIQNQIYALQDKAVADAAAAAAAEKAAAAAKEQRRIQAQIKDGWADVAMSVRDTIMKLRGDLIGGSSMNLTALKTDFYSTIQKVLGGDQSAATRLGGLSSSYSDALRDSSGSYLDFARQQSMMIGALSRVDDYASLNGGLTPAINKVNQRVPRAGQADSEAARELRALREEQREQKAVNAEMARNMKRFADYLDKWDAEGMPDVRAA